MRRIVSLTTIATRIAMLEPTLTSLLRQSVAPDEIILWLPRNYRRVGQKPLTEVPGFILESGISVRWCEDLGPFTSLGPNLRREDSDTIIVTADDDVLYPEGWFEGLVAASERFPDSALGYRGRIFKDYDDMRYLHTHLFYGSEVPRKIDVISGTWGALYKARFFDDTIFDLDSFPDSYHNDDLWISGYLARKRIPIHVLPDPGIEPIMEIALHDSLWSTNQHAPYNDAIIAHYAEAFRGHRSCADS